jgi:hypothetical protein
MSGLPSPLPGHPDRGIGVPPKVGRTALPGKTPDSASMPINPGLVRNHEARSGSGRVPAYRPAPLSQAVKAGER